ncbi:SDR family oxidoreductase [Enterobacter cloacae subsp. cloacae]|nr:SDR family oxidoreductase [Enterobacter cloacae subsp. cloacae]
MPPSHKLIPVRWVFRADVTTRRSGSSLCADSKSKEGRLDILLFANAGGGDMHRWEQSPEQFDRIFGTNVRGVLFTVQKALPLLSAGSSIILTSSTVSIKERQTLRLQRQQSRRAQLCPLLGAGSAGPWDPINVVSLAPSKPGTRRTGARRTSSGAVRCAGCTGSVRTFRCAGRGGKVVAFLASDAASFINATELFVDGGMAQI